MGILNRNRRQQPPQGQNGVQGQQPQGQRPPQQGGQQPTPQPENRPVLKVLMIVLFVLGAICVMWTMMDWFSGGEIYAPTWVIWVGVILGGGGIIPAVMASNNRSPRGRR